VTVPNMAPSFPSQPRHPRLAALLEANRARLRAVERRRARQVLAAAGLDPAIVRP
jgi:hypothetical protein